MQDVLFNRSTILLGITALLIIVGTVMVLSPGADESTPVESALTTATAGSVALNTGSTTGDTMNEGDSVAQASTPTPVQASTAIPAVPLATTTRTPIPDHLRIHVVESGDSLYRIAEQYGVTVEDLLLVNDLPDPSRLQIGDQILVPTESRVQVAAVSTATADSVTPFATGTSIPTVTDLPTLTETPVPTVTDLPSATPTLTFTPLPTATHTPTATSTFTPEPTLTSTPLPAAVSSQAVQMATATVAAAVPTSTPLPPTLTFTPTLTATSTATNTPPPTVQMVTATPDYTPTLSAASPAPADMGIIGGMPIQRPVMPDTINGLPVDSFIILTDQTIHNIRSIYTLGQQRGNNPFAFSKIGDSTIENPHFLARFDQGPYNLGPYTYLQPVIDHFQGSHSRQGAAVRRGLHSWSVFDPTWASDPACFGGETPIDCEFRLHNPSFVFIRLGSNDVGVPDSFDRSMRRIVETSIAAGVVPILGTKADRHEGPGNINNNIMRQIAADYHIPLWDFDVIAGTIPGRGLGGDNVHMTTFFAHDYTQPNAYRTGHGIHNLTALIMLDAVWRVVQQ